MIFNPLLVKSINLPELLGPRPNQETASELFVDVLRSPQVASASFHRMYVCQPPIQIQSIKMEYIRETKIYRHIRYAFGTGLTTLNVGVLGRDIVTRVGVPNRGESEAEFRKWFFCLSGAQPLT